MLQIFRNGGRAAHVINSIEDINELKSHVERSRSSFSHQKPAISTPIFPTSQPMPMLKKPPGVQPGSPILSRIPPLKRSFNNLSTICENEEVRELIAELKSRRNDKDALIDCDKINSRIAKCQVNY